MHDILTKNRKPVKNDVKQHKPGLAGAQNSELFA
jgi:hypothetical protein